MHCDDDNNIVRRYIIIRRACDGDEVKSHFIELYYDCITDI